MDPAERRLLAATPLHAITAARGEAGLRERLAIDTADLPAPARARIGRALALAGRLHAAHLPHVLAGGRLDLLAGRRRLQPPQGGDVPAHAPSLPDSSDCQTSPPAGRLAAGGPICYG